MITRLWPQRLCVIGFNSCEEFPLFKNILLSPLQLRTDSFHKTTFCERRGRLLHSSCAASMQSGNICLFVHRDANVFDMFPCLLQPGSLVPSLRLVRPVLRQTNAFMIYLWAGEVAEGYSTETKRVSCVLICQHHMTGGEGTPWDCSSSGPWADHVCILWNWT